MLQQNPDALRIQIGPIFGKILAFVVNQAQQRQHQRVARQVPQPLNRNVKTTQFVGQGIGLGLFIHLQGGPIFGHFAVGHRRIPLGHESSHVVIPQQIDIKLEKSFAQWHILIVIAVVPRRDQKIVSGPRHNNRPQALRQPLPQRRIEHFVETVEDPEQVLRFEQLLPGRPHRRISLLTLGGSAEEVAENLFGLGQRGGKLPQSQHHWQRPCGKAEILRGSLGRGQ